MIIISDVHGHYKTLLALIAKLPKDEKISFVGDLIDRGPRSKEVVQFIIDNEYNCCTGNHEVMMIDETMVDDNGNVRTRFNGVWMHNGGNTTINSYTTEKYKDDMSPYTEFDTETFVKHREWMKNLPLYLEYKDIEDDKGRHLFVSHSAAGSSWEYKNKKDYEYMFERDILWIRDLNPKKIPGIYNVFGHTPIENGPKIENNYACLDTGCFVTWEPGYGKITALQFPQMKVFQQENID